MPMPNCSYSIDSLLHAGPKRKDVFAEVARILKPGEFASVCVYVCVRVCIRVYVCTCVQ